MNQEEINNQLALTAMTAIAPEEIQSVEKMAVSSPRNRERIAIAARDCFHSCLC